MTKTPPPPTPAELPGWTAICWLLFSSFTFYVTFVQYALLRRATLVLHWAEKDLTPGFALLAICGIAGSLAAGYAIDRRKPFTDHLAQAAAGISGVVAVVAVAMIRLCCAVAALESCIVKQNTKLTARNNTRNLLIITLYLLQ